MPIVKLPDGTIQETVFNSEDEFLRTGVIRSDVFAIRDSTDRIRQMAFDVSALPTDTTLTVKAPSVGGNFSLVSPATKTLYVDKNRSDSYTADGSLDRPFLTIQAAINQVITNADNASFSYMIHVSTGTYAENLTLNNTALRSVYIYSPGGASLSPSTGDAVDCTSNNNSFSSLTFRKIAFTRPVTLTGSTSGGTTFLSSLEFNECSFSSTATIAFTNLVVSTFVRCSISATNTYTNVNTPSWLIGSQVTGTMTLTNDNGLNKPSGYSGVLAICDSSVIVTNITIGASCRIQCRGGARVGATGTSITVNGTLLGYTSHILSNAVTVNSGGVFQLNGGTFDKSGLTMASGSTYTDTTNVELLQYSAPATGATVTVDPQTTVLVLEPAGAIATLTVTLPDAANGKVVRFSTTAQVVSLTLNSATGTVVNAITTLSVDSFASYIFRTTGTKWYRIG